MPTWTNLDASGTKKDSPEEKEPPGNESAQRCILLVIRIMLLSVAPADQAETRNHAREEEEANKNKEEMPELSVLEEEMPPLEEAITSTAQ